MQPERRSAEASSNFARRPDGQFRRSVLAGLARGADIPRASSDTGVSSRDGGGRQYNDLRAAAAYLG